MNRYGIIGGSFDPIHNGHLYIAYEAKEQLELDEIVFMPAGKQPFKLDKKITDANYRYEMVKLAIQPYDDFYVSKYEIEKQGLSFTSETLEYFRENICNEDGKIFFITGADCLLDIEKWNNAYKIFNLCNLVVFARGGLDLRLIERKRLDIESKFNTKILFLNLNKLEISSSDIRDRVSNGKRVDFFLPKEVNQFIGEKKLYRE